VTILAWTYVVVTAANVLAFGLATFSVIYELARAIGDGVLAIEYKLLAASLCV
jgi:hypothetical protein